MKAEQIGGGFKRLHWAKHTVTEEATLDYNVESVNCVLMVTLVDNKGNEVCFPVELLRGIIAETDREWGRR